MSAMSQSAGFGRELPTVSVTEIPPLPEAALHILSVVRDPSASAARVAAAIGRDPSIALRFLSIANSAYYATSHRINTLQQCVACLGLEFVKATLITLGIGGDGQCESAYLDKTLMWQHNMGVATACEMICNRISGWQPGEAYTTGLTHDIGKQILLLTHYEDYERVLARAAVEETALYALENDELGLDHALVGALALREWKLSPEVVHVVLNHHDTEMRTEHAKLIAVLQLAHELCVAIGYGVPPHAITLAGDGAQDRLGLSDAVMESITEDLRLATEDLDGIITAISAAA